MTNKLLIVTGFMASGKDTIVNSLLERNRHFSRVVTHTSRPARKGETCGIDHHFVSKIVFEKLISDGEIIEHVLYETHYKGTSKSEIGKVFEEKTIIWRIDMERAANVEGLFCEKFDQKTAKILSQKTIKILLKPENLQVALQRYKSRDRMSFDKNRLIKRFDFETELFEKHKHKFPYVINNKQGKLDKTLEQINSILMI